jgi:phosphohistidine phosphatase
MVRAKARRDPALPRDLLVMRHAKSDHDPAVPRDFDRPLNRRGRRDAPRVGRRLAEDGLVPDVVVASPALRARETAVRASETLGLDVAGVLWDERLYDAGLEAILRVLGEVPPGVPRVLLVAHNPGLEDLVLHLGGDGVAIPGDGKVLPTGAVAIFSMPRDWGRLPPGCAALRGILRPREIR